MKLSDGERESFESHVQETIDAAFTGWDFSYMDQSGGNEEDPLEWCYERDVRGHLKLVDSVLGMGTGGGEFFATLQPFPPIAYATESYPPNTGLARETLEPLGVKVVGLKGGEQEDRPLPFDDGFFDLVVNRHESYDSKEVYRILTPGGLFVTQQVGDRNNENLRIIFGSIEDVEDFPWHLDVATGFLTKIEGLDHREAQLVMAKVTGNFKRGNERQARR